MLPTPRASDGAKGGPNQRGSSGDLMLPAAVMSLLPTPTASDRFGAGNHGDGGADLRTTIALLPTPVTEPDTGNGHARNLGREAKLLPTPTRADANGHHTRGGDRAAEALLPGVAMSLGATTSPPSDDGNKPSDEQPRPPR